MRAKLVFSILVLLVCVAAQGCVHSYHGGYRDRGYYSGYRHQPPPPPPHRGGHRYMPPKHNFGHQPPPPERRMGVHHHKDMRRVGNWHGQNQQNWHNARRH